MKLSLIMQIYTKTNQKASRICGVAEKTAMAEAPIADARES